MKNSPNEAVRFVKALFGNAALTIIARFAGISFTVLGAHHLGADDFGILLLVLGYVSVFSTFISFGVPSTITYFATKTIQESPGEIRSLLSTLCLFVSVVGFLILFILSFFFTISELDWRNEYEVYKIALSIIFVLSMTMPKLFAGFFRGLNFTQIASFIELTSLRLLHLFVILIGYYFKADLSEILLLLIAVSVLRLLLVFRYAVNYLEFSELNRKFLTDRSIWKYSFDSWITSTVSILRTRGDVILIGLFLSSQDVAIYGVAVSLASLFLFTSKIVGPTFRPLATTLLLKENITEFIHIYKKIIDLEIVLVLPFAVLVLIFSHELIASIFNSDFEQTALIFKILSSVYLFTMILGPTNTALLALSKTSVIRNADIMAGVLFFILFPLLVYALGLVGGVIAVAVVWVFQQIYKYRILYFEFGVSILPSKNILTYATASVVLGALLATYYSHANLKFQVNILCILLYFVSIFALGFKLKLIDISEIRRMRTAIQIRNHESE